MELSELKLIVKENFEFYFNTREYKLLPIWESDRSCHCGYAIVGDMGIEVEFSVSSSGIFEAKSSEILTSIYTLEHWIAFVKAIKQVCRDIWDKEHHNG